MKTLLLLTLAIFLTTQGMAQDTIYFGDTIWKDYYNDCDTFEFRMPDSIVDIMPVMELPEFYLGEPVRIITLKDIEAWIEHCNDTIHYSHEITIIDSIFDNGYSFHYDTIFTTKDPNDPEGFVKFLKEKK